ncbi:MAG: TRAP transporter small permease subunit [Pseudomonadota bacterium]
MAYLWAAYTRLAAGLSVLLLIGRGLAWIALGLMVLTILHQVVMRYGFNAAPNWTEELARFLMLWMTGLAAPSALRWGGFVAIDMVPRALPRVPGLLLNLFILTLALLVLVLGVQLGWREITGFGGRFASPSLWVPFDVTFATFEIAWEWTKVAKKYMFASLWVGCCLMTVVTLELMLRTVLTILDPNRDLPDDPHMMAAGAD